MQDLNELRRSLHSSLKRSKLETPYDAGDCGYYALCVGLLYLGMQAKSEPELARITPVRGFNLDKQPPAVVSRAI